jgi:hypothetical protein
MSEALKPLCPVCHQKSVVIRLDNVLCDEPTCNYLIEADNWTALDALIQEHNQNVDRLKDLLSEAFHAKYEPLDSREFDEWLKKKGLA